MTAGDDDRAARFRACFDACAPAITRYARRRLAPDDAADLVADCFTVAWRRLDDVPAGDAALLWLYGVARNLLRNRRRASRRFDAATRALAARFRHDLANRVRADPAEEVAIRDAIARLRPDDREVLTLAAWEGLAPSDIAVVLGVSANAAAIRLHRARTRLAALLDEPRGTASPHPSAPRRDADRAERTGPIRTDSGMEGREP